MTGNPSRSPGLVAVPNPEPRRDYEVCCETPEFTCLCPMTGQPDFATVTITYTPDEWIVELKSLKLYLWQYRQVGTFHEAVTNKIVDDFLSAIHPRRVTVRTDWLVRGGIHTVVEVTEAPPTNAGASDARASDTGASDTGASDAGATNAGASDAGASDAGASDAGATNAGATNEGNCTGRRGGRSVG